MPEPTYNRLPLDEPSPSPDYRSLPIGGNEAALGASPSARGGMSSASPTMSMIDDMIRQQTMRQGSTMYRIGSALAGQDPQAGMMNLLKMRMAAEGVGMQGEELGLRREEFAEKTRQFLVNKQLAVGTLVHQFLGEISKYPASQRGAVAQSVKGFLGPMMKEMGMPVPDTVLDVLINQPGAVDMYGGLIGTYFGKDPERIKQINAALENLKPEQVMPAIKTMVDLDTQQAKPGVMQTLERYTREMLPKLDMTTKQRIGLLDEKGKMKPISAGTLLNVFDSVAQGLNGKPPTPAEQRAAAEILSAPDLEGWRVGIGVASGTAAAEAAKTVATTLAREGTETGQADLAAKRAQAEAARVQARVGERDLAVGKVVPFTQEVGVARFTGAGEPEVVKPAEEKRPDAGTRSQLAISKSATERMQSILERMEKNPAAYFGMTTQGIGAARRGAEQVGISAAANPDYERFWADMDFVRSEYVRAMEKGNISKSDIDFFLAGFPERGTAPSVAVEKFSAAVDFANSRLSALSKEFKRGDMAPAKGKAGSVKDLSNDEIRRRLKKALGG